jgi:hypothetical protein
MNQVRIRFQNYLFKADKIISHPLGHNRIFIADRIKILLPKIDGRIIVWPWEMVVS